MDLKTNKFFKMEKIFIQFPKWKRQLYDLVISAYEELEFDK